VNGDRGDSRTPFEPALRPQFGLRALAIGLVAVSLTFALSRWIPAAIVLAVLFTVGLIGLHLFSTALGKKLRASRPDERQRRTIDKASPSAESSSHGADTGELRERRSIASLTSWLAVLAIGTLVGIASGWGFVGGIESRSLIVPAAGLAAFGFLGAVAGGLAHALAASLFVAHRQSVEASEAEGKRD
jgi:hypothetical protein